MAEAAGPTTEEVEALAARCYRSPVEFCRVFLPEWFPQPMPWVHRGVLAILEQRADFLLDFGKESWGEAEGEWTPKDLEKILTNFIDEHDGTPLFELSVDEEGNPKLLLHAKESSCIIMPRGFAKTTLINAANLKKIVYKDENFFLYVSESGGHAERQLATIKGQLEDNDGVPENELLNLVFGNHKPPRQSSKKWTEDFIETLKGVMVGAVGTGGQVRGFGKHAKRPGLIIFDDLQDEESVASDTQRAKDSSWFFRAARPAKKKGGRDIIIGTLLHNDAILNKCMRHRDFTAVRFGAIDRQGEALWEWHMSLEKVEHERQAAAEMGELTGFYMEYMSTIRRDETAAFPDDKLISIHKGKDLFVAMAQAVDPAISKERKGCMSALAVVGIEKGGQKHVLDFRGAVGMDADELLEEMFEQHFSWMAHLPPECQKHGIEAVQYQAALLPMCRAKMVEKSKTYGQLAYFEVDPIFHGRTQKLTRIKGILKPLIWAGQLTFEQRWGPLWSQLTDFPSGLLDGPDAIAMAVAKLDPYVMLGLGEEGEETLVQDNAPPLEKVLGGSFRSAP